MKCPVCGWAINNDPDCYYCLQGHFQVSKILRDSQRLHKANLSINSVIWKRSNIKTIDIWEIEQLTETDKAEELDSLRKIGARYYQRAKVEPSSSQKSSQESE